MEQVIGGKPEKLLNKTLKGFVLYSLIVFAASVPAYYYLVDSIWLSELDEHNEIIASRIENELNKLKLTKSELLKIISVWNKIQPGINLEQANEITRCINNTYTVLRKKSYTENYTSDRFRGLKRLVYINKEPYYLTVETNVEETEETVVAITLNTLLFFLILVAGFGVLNRWSASKLWKPFQSILSQLQAFDLNNHTHLTFEKSNILEFEQLNLVLGKLLEHNITAFKIQKEFTENASHELQTPLAIIKNKLDLLLQKETLTERQYQIIEEINRTLTRLIHINKNLLLLAKIENHQFDSNEPINISELIEYYLVLFKEYSDNKNISTHRDIVKNLILEVNKTLTEILLSNLLLNSIRHNEQNGIMGICLRNKELIISNSGNAPLNELKLFQRFAKASNESTGGGIGLALINQICRHYNWAISYQFVNNLHIFTIYFLDR